MQDYMKTVHARFFWEPEPKEAREESEQAYRKIKKN